MGTNMKKLIVILAAIIGLTANIYAGTPTKTNNATLAPMLKNVMPAVVNISVRGQLPPINVPIKPNQSVKVTPRFAGVGSGIIVDAKKGYIITNAHVVKDAKIIIVTLNDQRRLQGTLVGYDKKSDIAIIKIRAKHLSAIPFGDSDNLKVGDFVTAIGNPFGLSQTVTSGVVSSLNRSGLGIEGYENFIQTDAPINPGNSGGALIDMHGNLIGMNTAIISPYSSGGNVGIGFAIPSNMCKNVMLQIIKYGKVEHSMLGVIVQSITPTLADAFNLHNTQGALISQVNPGTPAAIAGLQQEDIITKLNGKPVSTSFQVSNTIGLLRPGTKITLQILRNGKTKTIHAVTESMKKAKAEAKNAPKPLLAGLSLRNYNQLIDDKQITGVQIVDVNDFSVAFSYGLRPGDVILTANNQSITNIQQLKKIANANPDKLLLKIQRGHGSSIFVVLEK